MDPEAKGEFRLRLTLPASQTQIDRVQLSGFHGDVAIHREPAYPISDVTGEVVRQGEIVAFKSVRRVEFNYTTPLAGLNQLYQSMDASTLVFCHSFFFSFSLSLFHLSKVPCLNRFHQPLNLCLSHTHTYLSLTFRHRI